MIKKTSMLVLTLIVVGTVQPAHAQLFGKKKEEPKKEAPAPQAQPPKKEKTIESETAKSKKMEGLFTVYQDTTNGSLMMEISADQLGKEFIYFTYTEDGAVSANHFRGQFRENTVLRLRRHYDSIEILEVNSSYYFDPSNPLSRAKDANISEAVLATQKIEVEDKKAGKMLIKADPLFLAENLHQVKPTPFPGQSPMAFRLGNLSKEKTKYRSIRNYPMNTDIIVEYVYDNPQPMGSGSDITNPRSVTVALQHSLIEVPKNGFKPRFDDARVGYFTTNVNDMISASHTPYRDMIHRWNLVKKDPNAPISEPVQPIVWWIENTTPHEFRDAIKEGVHSWNKAFEAAGFRNAMVAKVQPDDADWDAGDIRYNVLRWTSSPNPPFGGYGPSFVNPFTGEILGADIMLEYVYFTNRVKSSKLFEADNTLQTILEEQANHHMEQHNCVMGYHMYTNMALAKAALTARNASTDELNEYIQSSLVELVMHEVGHTLGLNHNMKASQLHDTKKINDKALTSKVGLTGSVMDYNAVNIARTKALQGEYHQRVPGPYDIWAIEFGYDPRVDDANYRKQLLAKSTQPELMFGNDADDMRSPGRGIDPRVMIGDLTSDAIEFGKIRFEVVRDLMKGLRQRYANEGESFQEFRDSFYSLMGNVSTQAGVVSRYVGGVYVDRAFAGQPGATKPFTPVSLADQKRAMKVLTDYVFAPNAFDISEDVYQHLQTQRRGFNFFGSNEDPKIHAMALNVHRNVLNHLTHPNVLARISDSELYGNKYDLASMMTDLTDALFKADLNGNVNGFRQNLQVEYVGRLAFVLSENGKRQYNYQAQSQALFQLNAIKAMLEKKTAGNPSTKAHTMHVLKVINDTLES